MKFQFQIAVTRAFILKIRKINQRKKVMILLKILRTKNSMINYFKKMHKLQQMPEEKIHQFGNTFQ